MPEISAPRIVRLQNSVLKNDYATLCRFAQILQDSVWDYPWKLRWDIGHPKDEASSSGSICAYHNLLLRNNADFLGFQCEIDGIFVNVGYAIGVKLTDDLIKHTHIAEGLSDEASPKAGDYYLAVAAIQGDQGVNDEPRVNTRGLKIRGKSVYRLLIELRLRLGFNLGSRNFWVRTATEQEVVRGIYGKIGFREVGNSEVKQGETTVARTVMACHFNDLHAISHVSQSVEGENDWISVE